MDQDKSDVTDTYVLANYAKVTDSPLMYTKPNYTSFNAGGMDLVLGVYSPTGKYKAADFKDNLEKMVVAQKKFLGDMNTNKKYAIMLYLSGGDESSIKGYGALEHHESTSVVLPEAMSKEAIDKSLTDVVSHEFFHTVNPLKHILRKYTTLIMLIQKCLSTYGCMKVVPNILLICSRYRKALSIRMTS